MSQAKEEIVRKVRQALDQTRVAPETDYNMIARQYIAAGTMDLNKRVALFVDRLHDYGAVVYRCPVEAISQTVGQAMEARGKQALIVPHGVREAWVPEGCLFIPDDDLSCYALDRSEGVLTGCALAIASTGTIVLGHSPAEGRRALSLVPDYHLCVVYENQIVETVPEGIRGMQAFQSAPITTISGPSATSDIEMTRIKGVHGPRILDIILAAT
jgi:L-lactate dehydrogenase complex protein LldG